MRRLVVVIVAIGLAAGGAGCSGDDAGGKVPTATVPKATTTTLSAVEREVEAAYLRSWDVYAHAMLSLDTTGLGEAFGGAALETKIDEVTDLKAMGQCARMRVDHALKDIDVEAGAATIRDEYVNHSVAIDAETREPIEADPNTAVSRIYKLQRSHDTWKVVEVLAPSPS